MIKSSLLKISAAAGFITASVALAFGLNTLIPETHASADPVMPDGIELEVVPAPSGLGTGVIKFKYTNNSEDGVYFNNHFKLGMDKTYEYDLCLDNVSWLQVVKPGKTVEMIKCLKPSGEPWSGVPQDVVDSAPELFKQVNLEAPVAYLYSTDTDEILAVANI